MASHHKCTKGNGNRTCKKSDCFTGAQTTLTPNDTSYLVTAYYANTTQTSRLTLFSPMASLHAISVLPTLTLSWQIFFLVIFTIATVLPSQLKKKAKKSINKTNPDQPDTEKDYNLIGSIDYSKKEKEHAIIAQDIAFWTRESVRGPDQYDKETAEYYSTDHDPKYKEIQAMIDDDDGFNDDHTLWDTYDARTHVKRLQMNAHRPTEQKEIPKLEKQHSSKTTNRLTANIPTKNTPTRPRHTIKYTKWKPTLKRTKRKTKSHKSKTKAKEQHRQHKQVSKRSRKKWQNQARQYILNWQPQHMDAYLAIPQVAVEWNVEPG
jgi:hypothetical protein